MTARLCVLLGAVALAIAVVAGAFGAHALRARLDGGELGVYQTAVQYHFWHALGMLGVGALMANWGETVSLRAAAWLLLLGLLLFSGSLYGVTLTGAHELGVITPFGGAAFIAAWVAVGWAAWLR